jgi:hypothetical protein
MCQRNESENTGQAHEPSNQEDGIQSYFSPEVDLQCPDHRDWQRQNDKVTDEGEDAVCHSDRDECVRDAVTWLCLVPEEGDGCALEDVGGEGCYCPAL